MSTPEGNIKRKVSAMLAAHGGVYYHMPVQNGMGRPSLDYVGCYNGKFFAIETKAPGKKPTLRQELTIKEMQQAGARVFVIDGNLKELEEWLAANFTSL